MRQARKARAEFGVRIVYNRLLGAWYIVRGPHQTPIGGAFPSKAAAQLHLMRKNPSLKQRKIYARRRKAVLAARDRVHDVAALATLVGTAHGSPNPRRRRRVKKQRVKQRAQKSSNFDERQERAIEKARAHKVIGMYAYDKNPLPRFLVQTAFGRDHWSTHAGFYQQATAEEYARMLAKSHPTATVRVYAPGAQGGPVRKKSNPVEPSRIANARRRYEDFSGMEATRLQKVQFPPNPKVGLAIGPIIAVAYETIRDGKVERYKHDFSSHARPLLAASHDGRSLYLLGGAYRFTERGIVDRAK